MVALGVYWMQEILASFFWFFVTASFSGIQHLAMREFRRMECHNAPSMAPKVKCRYQSDVRTMASKLKGRMPRYLALRV